MEKAMTDHRTVITIGTGAGIAAPGRGGAASLVQINDSHILLDCGEGVSGWLNALHKINLVDYIFISHLHPDHITGLFVLLQNMKISGRDKALHLVLPYEGIASVITFAKTVYLDFDTLPFVITTSPIQTSDLIQENYFSIHAWHSDHFEAKNTVDLVRPAFGFTIDSGQHRLVYTGDIASIDCFTAELNDKTTLICESAHVSHIQVIELAKRTSLQRVILVHAEPQMTESIENYCSRYDHIHLAHDSQKFSW